MFWFVLVCSAIIGRSTKDFKTCLLSFVKFMPLVSVVVFLNLVCKTYLKIPYYEKYTLWCFLIFWMSSDFLQNELSVAAG